MPGQVKWDEDSVNPREKICYFYPQEPLTTAMLAAAPMQEQKQMLGERLFPLIQVISSLPFINCQCNFVLAQRQHAEMAGKITGMLLEIDNSELLHMLEDPASLQGKVHCSVQDGCLLFHILCYAMLNNFFLICILNTKVLHCCIAYSCLRWRRR